MHRFLRAFWITIGREFHAIDRLRLDKYMYLIRCYVGVAFEIFVKGKQQQPRHDDGGKKRKREEEEAAAKSKNSKKQNKRSKGKKNQEVEEQSNGTSNANGTSNNDTQPSTTTTNPDSIKWTDLKSYLSIISEGPMNPLNFDPDQDTSIDEKNDYVPMPHGPDGLRYHLMDLWLDELEKVLEFQQEDSEEGAEEEKPRKVISEVPMDLILGPIETLRVQGLHKPVRTRAAEALEDERLFEWGFKERRVEEDEDDESEEEWGGFD